MQKCPTSTMLLSKLCEGIGLMEHAYEQDQIGQTEYPTWGKASRCRVTTLSQLYSTSEILQILPEQQQMPPNHFQTVVE